MQMQIGSFAFQAQGPEYVSLARRSARRWMPRERHGRPPALDDLGRQADEITLRGTVIVQTARDLEALSALREAAGLAGDADAAAMPVYIGGGAGSSGTFLGYFAIRRLRTTERDLRLESIPARIDFQVELLEDVDGEVVETIIR